MVLDVCGVVDMVVEGVELDIVVPFVVLILELIGVVVDIPRQGGAGSSHGFSGSVQLLFLALLP